MKSFRLTNPIGISSTSIRGRLYGWFQIYRNGWLALCLELADTEEPYTILTVNLEEMDAIGLPDKAFIDINNNPDAMEFLVLNNLATDTGYRRGSGWVEYPMVHVNLPLVFQHCPESFNRINIYA